MKAPYYVVKRTCPYGGYSYLGDWPYDDYCHAGPWHETQREAVPFADKAGAEVAADYARKNGDAISDVRVVKIVPRSP